MKRYATAMLLLFALRGLPAAAQEPEAAAPALPDSVARYVVDVYNRAGTVRLAGDAHLPSGASIDGDVALLGGRLTIGGTVRGAVVVINGDLLLEAGASVAGPVTVVGGVIAGDRAALGAGGAAHPVALDYRQEGDRLVRVDARRDAPETAARIGFGHRFAFGTARFHVAAGGGYNRVEGLPLHVGPQFRFGDSNPTILSALAIYRTASGLRLDPDRLGYSVGVDQYLGGRRRASISARAFS
jgi:hypothetical protein